MEQSKNKETVTVYPGIQEINNMTLEELLVLKGKVWAFHEYITRKARKKQ